MKAPATSEKMTSALSLRRHYTQLDLFADAVVAAPAIPKPGTVKEAALKRLIVGPVTQLDFPNSWRLAAYVDELGNDGWAIASKWVQPTGCQASIKEYSLDLRDPTTRAAVAAYRAQCAGQ